MASETGLRPPGPPEHGGPPPPGPPSYGNYIALKMEFDPLLVFLSVAWQNIHDMTLLPRILFHLVIVSLIDHWMWICSLLGDSNAKGFAQIVHFTVVSCFFNAQNRLVKVILYSFYLNRFINIQK
jgi:flagellar biosynthesis protein FliQ